MAEQSLTPQVSICIPAYKSPELLRRLLDSAFSQTYTDYEVIVTDDTPDDSVRRVIDCYAGKGARYYRHDATGVAAANWNYMLSLAKGEYIKPMFTDDFFTTPDSLRGYVELIESNGADFAFSGSAQVKAEASYRRHISENNAARLTASSDNIFCANDIGAPSAVIFRRDDTCFDENLVWLVDVDFYIGYLRRHPKLCYTTEPLVSIGMHGDQLTATVGEDRALSLREHSYVYKKYSLARNRLCGSWMFDLLQYSESDWRAYREHKLLTRYLLKRISDKLK